jgi:hypothetical protein
LIVFNNAAKIRSYVEFGVSFLQERRILSLFIILSRTCNQDGTVKKSMKDSKLMSKINVFKDWF